MLIQFRRRSISKYPMVDDIVTRYIRHRFDQILMIPLNWSRKTGASYVRRKKRAPSDGSRNTDRSDGANVDVSAGNRLSNTFVLKPSEKVPLTAN
jgi:hypothetical protein